MNGLLGVGALMANVTATQARQLASAITSRYLQSEDHQRALRKDPVTYIKAIERDMANAFVTLQQPAPTGVASPGPVSPLESRSIAKGIDTIKEIDLILDLATLVKNHVPQVYPNVKATLERAEKLLKKAL